MGMLDQVASSYPTVNPLQIIVCLRLSIRLHFYYNEKWEMQRSSDICDRQIARHVFLRILVT